MVYHHRTQGHGAEGVHIKGVVDGLVQLGYELDIISPPGVDPLHTAGSFSGKKKKPTFKARLLSYISDYSPQWFFEISELVYNIFGYKKLNFLLKNRKPEFIYERYALFLLAGVWAKRKFGVPLILEVNDCGGLKRSRKQSFVRLADYIENIVFSSADSIIVVSSFLKDELLKRGITEDKVHVFPNSVDVCKFNPNVSDEKYKNKYNLVDVTSFGFVGWFDPWDRLDFLIEAFSVVHKERPETRLLLIGDGPGRQKLQNLIEEYRLSHSVILTGAVQRNEIQSLIAALDVCVIPHSNLFGSPIVLFEFMAMAKAVIAPSLPPILDVLTDKENGLIFNTEDKSKLVENMMELIDNPELRQQYGQSALKKVERDHLWIQCAERVVSLVDVSGNNQEDIT